MNAKSVVALILVLQVSMSLCEIPAPSQELVDKYMKMKETFQRRLGKLSEKLQVAAAPYVESEHAQVARERVEQLQASPEFRAAMKFVQAVGEEMSPAVDKARTSLLGLYEKYIRPHIGQSLSDGIGTIKVHLDTYMPAE